MSEPLRAPRWLEEYYAEVDQMTFRHLDLCAEDITVRFGNNPPVHGRAAFREALADFWSRIGGIDHELTHVIEDGDTTVVEANVTYTLHDGSRVHVPAASVLHRRDGIVDSMRVYIDLAPVLRGRSER